MRAQPMDAEAVGAALADLRQAALAAGPLALPFFRSGAPTKARITTKAGGSPVTEADQRVNRYLADWLQRRFPDAGWLSEESTDSPERLSCRRVLIVDPIDGTRGFAAGDPRWTICIGLVVDGRPVAGVVHAPALGETYAAGLGVDRSSTRRASVRDQDARPTRSASPVPSPLLMPSRHGVSHCTAIRRGPPLPIGSHNWPPGRLMLDLLRSIRTIGTSPPSTSLSTKRVAV